MNYYATWCSTCVFWMLRPFLHQMPVHLYLTEEEMDQLYRTMGAAVHRSTLKSMQTMAMGMATVSNELWPSGSQRHIAMRSLTPAALATALSAEPYAAGLFPWSTENASLLYTSLDDSAPTWHYQSSAMSAWTQVAPTRSMIRAMTCAGQFLSSENGHSGGSVFSGFLSTSTPQDSTESLTSRQTTADEIPPTQHSDWSSEQNSRHSGSSTHERPDRPGGSPGHGTHRFAWFIATRLAGLCGDALLATGSTATASGTTGRRSRDTASHSSGHQALMTTRSSRPSTQDCSGFMCSTSTSQHVRDASTQCETPGSQVGTTFATRRGGGSGPLGTRPFDGASCGASLMSLPGVCSSGPLPSPQAPAEPLKSSCPPAPSATTAPQTSDDPSRAGPLPSPSTTVPQRQSSSAGTGAPAWTPEYSHSSFSLRCPTAKSSGNAPGSSSTGTSLTTSQTARPAPSLRAPAPEGGSAGPSGTATSCGRAASSEAAELSASTTSPRGMIPSGSLVEDAPPRTGGEFTQPTMSAPPLTPTGPTSSPPPAPGAEETAPHQTLPPGQGARSSEIVVWKDPREDYLIKIAGEVAVLCEDEGKPLDLAIGAIRIGPFALIPQVYASTCYNLRLAVQKRIVEKQRKCQPTAEDKLILGKLVRASISDTGIFARSRIVRWMSEHPDLEDEKSGKWMGKRYSNVLGLACDTADEYMDIILDFMAKKEAGKEGRPPRLLMLDKDLGQLVALYPVSCFESLLYSSHEVHSTKHRPSTQAVLEIMASLRTKTEGGVIVEGDGSAWDTTCGVSIRSMAEQPVLMHIMKVMLEHQFTPSYWLKAVQRLEEKTKIKIVMSKQDAPGGGKEFGRFFVAKIDAIRRSGARGTSCFNWWLNFVLWCTALFKNPQHFLDPKRANSISRWSEKEIKMLYAFEGDDSLLRLIGAEALDLEEAEKTWQRFGFNMRLNIVPCCSAGGVAEFCGHLTYVDARGPDPSETMPDLARALVTTGWTTSRTIISGVMKPEPNLKEMLQEQRYASYMGRALSFAGSCTEAAYYFRACAGQPPRRLITDREMSFKLGGEGEEVDTSPLEAAFFDACDVRPRCRRLISRLGLSATSHELGTLMALGPGCVHPDDQVEGLLPASWLRAVRKPRE